MNKSTLFINTETWQSLLENKDKLNHSKYHLKNLIKNKNRFKNFTKKDCGLFYDFSKQRIDESIFSKLIHLSEELNARNYFNGMATGEIVNITENRAALHTATREFHKKEIIVNNKNVLPEIINETEKIKNFSENIRTQKIKSQSGKPFTDVVVIGIGGSYLGCSFVYNALLSSYEPDLKLHFLANVDIDNFGEVVANIDPSTTLWVVISKSYTTTETMANLNQVYTFLKDIHIIPEYHIVTVTSKGSPGDAPESNILSSFNMFDFIGGRYSVTSAVGGLPLSLAFGYDVFKEFLKGAHEMDEHAANADNKNNIPLISALINVWNLNALNYNAIGIIPYSSALSKLAPHIQQLYMESLGKSVTIDNEFTEYSTGGIIFGEPGTNAQHSFFQLAHQGMEFPIEFIGVLNPGYNGKKSKFNGVYNHQELFANMISQAKALATGKEHSEKAKSFKGNRPSTTIILENLNAENLGRLLSYYEAKTVYEGLILNINPFDQFGVELGKQNAKNLRKKIAKRNTDAEYEFSDLDDASKFYLELLFSGKLV